MENGVEKKETQTGVPRVRTYERDVEEFLKKEGGTAADFALAEQERRITNYEQDAKIRTVTKIDTNEERIVTSQKPPTTPPRGLGTPPQAGGEVKISIPSPQVELLRRNARSLVLWSISFLFLAGAVGIGYWYISNREPQTHSPVRVGTAKIILADKEKVLDVGRLARDTFVTAFTREREAALALSSFTIFTPTKTERGAMEEITPHALTTSEFLSLLGASAPGELVRALAPEFALGLRGLPTNHAFLIFKTNYFQTALAGMLRWEGTLLNDIGPLLGEAINESAPAGTSDAFTKRVSRFTDHTFNNRDVRELLDGNGKPLLLYGFANKQTIIITDDEDTFEKTMGKLVAVP